MANPESKRLQVDVVARIDRLEKEMKKAGRVVDKEMTGIELRGKQMTSRLDAQFSKIGGGLKGGAIAAFAGIGAGAAAALAPIALFNTALATINDASRLVDVADRIGLTTTALQELSFGFSQAGVEAATFETGMEQFSKRIGEAATSGGKLADILKANGIAIRDSNGQIRSSESLLGSYAELVRNAASEQEKMLLVTEAFGRGGGDMVNALNDGAAGINNMKKAAADAGGVIDEELLRRAEEMGDRWEAAWRRFTVSSQSAILTAVQGLDEIRNKFAEFEKQKAAAALGDLAGSMVGQPGSVPTTRKDARPTGLDARMAGALATELSAADTKLVDALKARYGQAAVKATIIPSGAKDSGGGGGGSTRNAEAAAALREAESVLRVLEALRAERAEIGMSDVERAKSTALRQAGKAATAEQRAEIEMLVAAIYREEEATQRASDAAAEFADIGKDVLGGFITDLRDGKSGAEALADALDKVADKLLDMSLSSLFDGGGAGGLFGSIAKIFGFKDGGIAAHGRPLKTFARGGVSNTAAIFGEAGPEAAVPLPDGRRIPVDLRAPSIPNRGGGGREVIDINLHTDTGLIAEIADQRVQASSGTIVRVAVQQSQKATKNNMAGYMADAQARRL